MRASASFEKVVAGVFGAWVLLAICLQTWGVLSRNVLSWSTAWLDDLQRLNFIWLIWVLAAVAYGTRGLIRLDLLQSALTGRPRAYHAVSLGIAVFELIFGLSFTVLGARILQTHLGSGETTVAISLPVWVLTSGFVIGSLLISVFAARNVLREAGRLVTGAPVQHESEIAQEVDEALEAEPAPLPDDPDAASEDGDRRP
ncbi:TRAP transporter small permease [Brachybacterium hainanense]|uniref:TRAP transporter small permease n=1 Tax=Brachybacterium hainanense TaxID=1541174 RepID=A0ABV6R9I7_9MICO